MANKSKAFKGMKKRGRKPLAKKRAANRRKTTEAKVANMLANLGYNPFHMKPDTSESKAATRSLTRAIRRFQQDYVKIIDKYSKAVPSEPITRQSVLSTLTVEMSKQLA